MDSAMKLLFLSEEQINDLQYLIKVIVREEFAKFTPIYEREMARKENASYVSQKEAIQKLGISRQTLYSWEKGEVSVLDISPFVKRQGRFKFYDIAGIKSLREEVQVKAEKYGSTRFSKPAH